MCGGGRPEVENTGKLSRCHGYVGPPEEHSSCSSCSVGFETDPVALEVRPFAPL